MISSPGPSPPQLAWWPALASPNLALQDHFRSCSHSSCPPRGCWRVPIPSLPIAACATGQYLPFRVFDYWEKVVAQSPRSSLKEKDPATEMRHMLREACGRPSDMPADSNSNTAQQ